MLQELTLAFVIFITPDGIASSDMHIVSVGRAPVEQCVAELDLITEEFPDRVPMRRECIVREVEVPGELPQGHPPVDAKRPPADDEA